MMDYIYIHFRLHQIIKYSLLIIAILITQFQCTSAQREVEFQKYLIEEPTVQKASFLEYGICDDGSIAMMNIAEGYVISFGHDHVIPVDNMSFISTDFWVADRLPCWQNLAKKASASNNWIKEISDLYPGYRMLLNRIRRIEMNLDLSGITFSPDKVDEWISTKSVLSDKKIDLKFKANSNGVIYSLKFEKIPTYSLVKYRWDYSSLVLTYQFDNAREKLILSDIALRNITEGVERIVKMKFDPSVEQKELKNNTYTGTLSSNDVNPFIINIGKTELATVINRFEEKSRFDEVTLSKKQGPYLTMVTEANGKSKPTDSTTIQDILELLK